MTKGRNALLFESGIQASYVILVAYLSARKDGIGDHIDISILEAQLAGTKRRTANLLTYQYTGDISHRVTPTEGGFSIVPPILPCEDGYVTLAIGPKKFLKFLTLMGRTDYTDNPGGDANITEITPIILKIYHECSRKPIN